MTLSTFKVAAIGMIAAVAGIALHCLQQSPDASAATQEPSTKIFKPKKTNEMRALYAEERAQWEYDIQKNPLTGEIPQAEKDQARQDSYLVPKRQPEPAGFAPGDATSVLRGPTNLGGRTRAIAFDAADASGSTILSGGVTSGLFRTTDGGASWTKTSNQNEPHSVTCIAQNPLNNSTWYYGTGEFNVGSTTYELGFTYYGGDGIYQSTDGGLSWNQMPSTASVYESNDSEFDFVTNMAISPTTGTLIAACAGSINRWNGASWTMELNATGNVFTDIVVASNGTFYAAFAGNANSAAQGVWRSTDDGQTWTRIAQSGSPAGWASTGRCVLATAPSNANRLYALYTNGASGSIEADLWQFDNNTGTWTDRSGKMPDEAGGDLAGNDPFAVQGGYDLVINVKPDDQDFVVIGGTNIYKISDIATSSTFERIGGYASNLDYGLWSTTGDQHHPDIHALEFTPNNANTLYSGTDGGIHRTMNVNTTAASATAWTSLNNNYVTYQFYHAVIDQQAGSDLIMGGTQDNGTVIGGTTAGLGNLTDMKRELGGDGCAVGFSRYNACGVTAFFSVQNGGLFRECNTWNTGANFGTAMTPAGSSSEFVTYFHVDEVNDNAIYYAGQNTLYRNLDCTTANTTNWTNMGNTGALGETDYIRSMATTWQAYDPATSYLLIGGDEGSVFRLDDPQNNGLGSAVNITPPGASTGSPSIVTDVAIHPTNPDIAMCVYGNFGITNVFVTSNATAASPTWTAAEQNLSNFSFRSCAIVVDGGETVYVAGTGRGLYSSLDPTTDNWVQEGVNEFGYALISSLSYRPSDNTLLCGTHGDGMYTVTVSGEPDVPGCTDFTACNFNPLATLDDFSCTYPGCNDPVACNYNAAAGCLEEGSCTFPGCSDALACNYDAAAQCLDVSLCTYPGCTDAAACNYDPNAGCDSGICVTESDDCVGACYSTAGQGQDFTGPYAPANWTFDPQTGNGSYNHAVGALAIVGNNNPPDGAPTGTLTQVTITAANTGDFSFDWEWVTTDNGLHDVGYYINGVRQDLFALSGTLNEVGSVTFTATAGDVIGFGIDADDGCCGYGELLVTNFTFPFDVCGCTDAMACNYNPSATLDDGTCTLPSCDGSGGCLIADVSNNDFPIVSTGLSRTLTIESLDMNGQGNVVYVNPGEGISITVDGNFSYTGSSCPGCVTQAYGRINGEYTACLSPTSSGAFSFADSFNAPATPGVYYMNTNYSWQFSCLTTTNTFPGFVPETGTGQCTIATIVVGDDSCVGCTAEGACNYDPVTTVDDGSCVAPDGCDDVFALNYCPSSTCSGGCVYADDCGFQYSNDPGMTGGFVGDFAEANWTLNYGDGDGTITFSETELVIVGNNDPFASENIYTLAITTVSESGLYAFTYGYSSNDSDANYDPAYYYNGSWVVLENAVGVTAGSGTLWILLEAGDEFGWAVESTDGCCGEATLFVKWFAHPGEGLECVPGCTNSLACNYDMAANADNGSCEFSSCAGCVYPGACNYNALATLDDGSCEYTSCAGCTYSDASNYDMMASVDDGSCMFDTATDSCPEDLDDNGEIGTSDLLIILAVYGADCPDPAP